MSWGLVFLLYHHEERRGDLHDQVGAFGGHFSLDEYRILLFIHQEGTAGNFRVGGGMEWDPECSGCMSQLQFLQ
jgi:hypothetical protein